MEINQTRNNSVVMHGKKIINQIIEKYMIFLTKKYMIFIYYITIAIPCEEKKNTCVQSH